MYVHIPSYVSRAPPLCTMTFLFRTTLSAKDTLASSLSSVYCTYVDTDRPPSAPFHPEYSAHPMPIQSTSTSAKRWSSAHRHSSTEHRRSTVLHGQTEIA